MPSTIPTLSETSTFASDIAKGLSKYPKQISSKYFYDAAGDRLFQQIMAMPAYYLTNCEFEIFDQQKTQILEAFGDAPFELIELGAGDGTKTKILLDYFVSQGSDFVYRPIDISHHVLEHLVTDCNQQWPSLQVAAVRGEYLTALAEIQAENNERRKIVLFLGGNIGNFTRPQAIVFLNDLASHLSANDLLLTGFDLKKDPTIILAAYNDPEGITAAFNLNLLHRINKELQGNFKVDQFFHWESYNPESGEARSYIVSKIDQTVSIDLLQLNIHFAAWEPIAVEVSAKYSERDIAELAKASGFELQNNFSDERNYFVDSLWELSSRLY